MESKMLNRIGEGFERYPGETTEAVWWILVQASVVGGAAVMLVVGLILAWAMWMAR